MLALDYYLCPGCGTVFAALDGVERCDECGESAAERLTPEGTGADYFDVRARRDDPAADADDTCE